MIITRIVCKIFSFVCVLSFLRANNELSLQRSNKTSWSSWACIPKFGTCGEHVKVRTRKCIGICPGKRKQTKPCFKFTHCPVNGIWSSWSEIRSCSVTCGTGVKILSRKCNNPSPQHGGKNCKGSRLYRKTCVRSPCKARELWSSWTKCSKSCGEGTQLRFMHCTETLQKREEKMCKYQLNVKSKSCYLNKCPGIINKKLGFMNYAFLAVVGAHFIFGIFLFCLCRCICLKSNEPHYKLLPNDEPKKPMVLKSILKHTGRSFDNVYKDNGHSTSDKDPVTRRKKHASRSVTVKDPSRKIMDTMVLNSSSATDDSNEKTQSKERSVLSIKSDSTSRENANDSIYSKKKSNSSFEGLKKFDNAILDTENNEQNVEIKKETKLS